MQKFIISLFLLALGGCATQPAAPPEEAVEQAKTQYQQAADNFRRGEMLRALEATERALKLNPNLAPAYELQGLINQTLGRMDKAGEAFQTALKLTPSEPSVLNNYGNLQCLRKNYGAAMELFQRAAASALNTQPAIAHTNAGLCSLKAADSDSAKVHFERAIELDPRQPNALYQLSQISLNNGDNLSANMRLSQYLENHPHNAKSLLLGAKIESRLSNPLGLNDYIEKLRQGFPGSKETQQAEQLSLANNGGMLANDYAQQTIYDENWVNSRPPSHFTIHVATAASREELSALMVGIRTSKRAIYPSANASYTLIVGEYNDFKQAQQALKSLPENINRSKPWIRNFEGIQATLKN